MFSADFKHKEFIEEKDLSSLFFAFLNRARFDYTLSNICDYVTRCLCFKSLDDLRRMKQVKRHYLFEKAEGKFMNELDVVRIVKTLRKFKMLAQAMLT